MRQVFWATVPPIVHRLFLSAMKFRSRKQKSGVIEINLIPMMDVLMTVLTFFIIVSMTLTSQKSLNVQLPQTGDANPANAIAPDPLVVGINPQGEILLDDQPTTREDLIQQMQSYLAERPEGVVILKADRTLDYQRVVEVLAMMQEVGGDRVSLAIESN
jgi:biopolymer transport protein ExbD